MDENKDYTASFEIKEVTASTLSEFAEKVEGLTKNGEEVSAVSIILCK